MMHQAIRWLTACALVCVGLLIGRVDVRAGDKQGGTPAPGGKASIFKANGTALDLKDAKGKYDGELNADDPQVQNHYYKIFLVKMETGKTYRIDHMSGDFDAFLFLEDPAGNKLTQDDDGGEGLNSRILFYAPKDGMYRVIATTLPPNKTGKFVLEINPPSAAEAKEAALFGRVSTIDTVAAAEQNKLILEVTAHLKDKGTKLSINDARLALEATAAVEGTERAAAILGQYAKLLKAADNPGVSGVAKTLEKVGQEFPVAGKTLDGKDFDLKNLKGKVVLVDFWATWCGPCIAEMPRMLSAHAKYNKRGFEVIGITLDKNDDVVVKFNEARKIPWNSINVEDSRKLANEYQVNSIPFPVLIDQSGRVVSIRARGPHLDRLLERMLPEKK